MNPRQAAIIKIETLKNLLSSINKDDSKVMKSIVDESGINVARAITDMIVDEAKLIESQVS